uniref:PGG domain-containing protein n=1 Tax=Quercus lobata TaxID=97700 RepID=A0A7N2N535_QUELO
MTDKERKKDDIDQPATAILIAAKNGITEMVEKILERHPIAIIFNEVDCDGNSALHLAAEADFNWPVLGAASQMQWEIKWYEYIKNSMQRSSGLPLLSKNGQTPEDVFTEKHKDLVKMGVPDGVKEVNKNNKASKVLAVSSFISFCTSLIAVVMFLSILTSVTNGIMQLPCICMVTCLLLITFFVITQFPMYLHLLWANLKKCLSGHTSCIGWLHHLMHKLLHWVACCAVAAESASPGALAAALSDMLRYTSVVAGDASSGFSYKV